MKKFIALFLTLVSLNVLLACASTGQEASEWAGTSSSADIVIDDADDYAPIEEPYWEAMAPEECFPGELYDPEEEVCYIECDTEAECLAIEEEIYAGLDAYLNPDFQGLPTELGTQSGDYIDQGDLNEDTPIARYRVDNTLDLTLIETDQPLSDSAEGQMRREEIWGFLRYLLPNDVLKEEVRQFIVFSDGVDETLAYVEQLEANPNAWVMAVDIADAGNMVSPDFVHTVVHEFGHIITLKKDQVPPDLTRSMADELDGPSQGEEACRTFYTGEGCANAQSYINLFFDRFWQDIFDEHIQGVDTAGSQEEEDDFIFGFYDKYQDRFVSDYAATNPGEDIAETFAFFILEARPSSDTLADQKILFFYQFEKLVQIRRQIRSQLARVNRN